MRATALALIVLCAGCAYSPTTSLRYEPVVVDTHAPSVARVGVLPLADGRGPKKYPGLQGHLFKTYIPLLPYVRVPYERLDESYALHRSNLGQATPSSELFTFAMAREIARDLEASGLFREVRFASDPAAAAGCDLVLSGTLRSTEFEIYASSYLLGAAGVLLWILPIPLGKDAATVAIDLELRDAAGSAVWSHAFSERASRLFTLYDSSGKSTSSRYRIEITRYGSNRLGIDGDSLWAYHAEALRKGMGGVKESLATALPALPATPAAAAGPTPGCGDAPAS